MKTLSVVEVAHAQSVKAQKKGDVIEEKKALIFEIKCLEKTITQIRKAKGEGVKIPPPS